MGDYLAGIQEKMGQHEQCKSQVNGKHRMVMRRIGLIVNPVAGIGGRVGLKGSDGCAIQKQARALGAIPQASQKAKQALEELRPHQDDLEVITCPGEMGATSTLESGFTPRVIGSIRPGHTTPDDTQRAAQQMMMLGVELLLFAGGDGTARDIYVVIGTQLPVLGIPAGVKIHSGVFAASPVRAGELAVLYLVGKQVALREVEVVDIDEQAVRQGMLEAKLFGYLQVPYERRMIPGLKCASPPGEATAIEAIAIDIIEQFEADCLYILGPGTTIRGITTKLGLEKTLLGVDVIQNQKLVAADVNEAKLLDLIEGQKARIIITPIGGQGFLFGRGNQQISPQVIARIGKENLIVVSTAEKIYALNGRPLLVDTGDARIDRILQGYIRVATGYGETLMYKVSS